MKFIKDFISYPVLFAILGLLSVLISYIELLNHQTETTLFLIGWVLLIVSGLKYYKND